MTSADTASQAGAVLDLSKLQARLPELRTTYQSASPFPHIVLDDFLEPGIAHIAMAEFAEIPPDNWMSYVHVNERKLGNIDPTTWGPTLREILVKLQSPEFVGFLSELTGIANLLKDDSLQGGGLHQSLAGGYLNVHADFTVHPRHRDWRRRVNLLLYLNEEWPAEFGGDLELWSTDMARCERKVAPLKNRVVIFTTDSDSFHGHPDPLNCPEGMARRSLALYYFTVEKDPLVRSTEYRARPGDSRSHSAMIFVDKQVLRLYDWAKRRIGLSDESASSFLGKIDRFRSKFRR